MNLKTFLLVHMQPPASASQLTLPSAGATPRIPRSWQILVTCLGLILGFNKRHQFRPTVAALIFKEETVAVVEADFYWLWTREILFMRKSSVFPHSELLVSISPSPSLSPTVTTITLHCHYHLFPWWWRAPKEQQSFLGSCLCTQGCHPGSPIHHSLLPGIMVASVAVRS